MSTFLEDRAKKLANQPYTITIIRDETTDGEPIFVLYNPELPGCMAQGMTIQEALDNLLDVRQQYLLSLLEDNLPVPLPEQHVTRTGVAANNERAWSFTIALGSSLKLAVEQLSGTPQPLVYNMPPDKVPDKMPDEQEQATVSLVSLR